MAKIKKKTIYQWIQKGMAIESKELTHKTETSWHVKFSGPDYIYIYLGLRGIS